MLLLPSTALSRCGGGCCWFQEETAPNGLDLRLAALAWKSPSVAPSGWQRGCVSARPGPRLGHGAPFPVPDTGERAVGAAAGAKGTVRPLHRRTELARFPQPDERVTSSLPNPPATPGKTAGNLSQRLGMVPIPLFLKGRRHQERFFFLQAEEKFHPVITWLKRKTMGREREKGEQGGDPFQGIWPEKVPMLGDA